jgi:hypothetical protein
LIPGCEISSLPNGIASCALVLAYRPFVSTFKEEEEEKEADMKIGG